MAEELLGEAGERTELAYDTDNLNEDMERFNQQQLLALQLLIQSNSLKREAESSAQCTVAAVRQKEELRRERERKVEAARNEKKVKRITIEQKVEAKKKIDLDELLTEIEWSDATQAKPTENEHRCTWLKNTRVLGF